MNDDLTDRLRAWATLDRIEAAPVLSADLTEAADRIGDLELRLAECEADRTILAARHHPTH